MNTLNSYPESLYVKRTGDTYTGSFTYGIMATRYGNAVPNSWIMIFLIKPGFLMAIRQQSTSYSPSFRRYPDNLIQRLSTFYDNYKYGEMAVAD